ncbi:MAG: site-2 protease family protein [Bacillaceae bacterium]
MELERSQKKKWGAIVAVGLLLLSKAKFLLPLLKVLKLHTLASMFISIGAYALVYGWQFAIVLVYLMFIHESGHLWAAKRVGIPTTPAIFIPFMGAVVGLKEMPRNARDEAYMAYMGPLFGLLSFLPAIPLYLYTEEPVWALMITLGSLLNLFNLIPVSPLDGGRIVSVISTKFWFIGLIILAVFSFFTKSAIGILILIMGVISLVEVYKKQKLSEQLDFQLSRLSIYDHCLKSKIERYGYHPFSLLKMKKEYEERIIQIENEGNKGKKEKGELALLRLSLKTVERLHDEFEVVENEAGENVLPMVPTEFVEFKEAQQEWEENRDSIRGYYNADGQTRLKYTLLYTMLVIVLAGLNYWGQMILPSDFS